MDPVTMALIGAGGSALFGAIGDAVAQGDYGEAERLRVQAIQQYDIDLPSVEDIASQAVQSQAAGAQGSQEAKASRLEALRMLQQRAQEGYTAEDKAAINEGLGEVQAAERGSREAIMRRMDPNSGAAIAAQLSNQQAGAQRANKMGLDVVAQGRRNALQALAQQGQLAGQIDEGEFGQSFGRGQASDAISQFNERNRLGAAEGNRAARMGRAEMQMGLADRKAGALMDRADAKDKRGQRKAATWAGAGQGISQAGYGAYDLYLRNKGK